jgi:hypothetical protein
MSLLPFQDAERLDPFGALTGRRARFAQAIAATTLRRDTRRRRAQVLLMLLQFRCPLRGNSRRGWYVAGAVARMGADWIETTWRTFWQEEAPSMRTIREHLRKLQECGVLVAAPGDWLPMLRQADHPERRPRYPDTYHLLDSDAEAHWWADVGLPRLEQNPSARHNPTLWRRLFASWRDEVAKAIAPGFSPAAEVAESAPRQKAATKPVRQVQNVDKSAILALELAVARADDDTKVGRLALLTAAAEMGARIQGQLSFQMLAGRGDVRGAVAMLAQALRRSKPITNRAGWLVAAWRDATPAERFEAISAACRSAYTTERVAT